MWLRYLFSNRNAAPHVPMMTRVRVTKNLLRRLVKRRRWSEIEQELLHFLVPEGCVSIDVGANSGSYTVPLALLSKRVISVEPEKSHCDIIKSKRLPNVTVVQKAMSSKKGLATLIVPKSSANGKDLVGLASLEPRVGLSASREVSVETGCLNEFRDYDVGFVKIDVEGHELEVLMGSKVLIEQRRPVFIVEVEDRHRQDAVISVFRFFADFAYHGIFIHGDKIRDIEDFSSEFADATVLDLALPLKEIEYVNNFIFFQRLNKCSALNQRLRRT